MKDTLHSRDPTNMYSSSKAMEACVSPTSTPAKLQWSKTTPDQPFQDNLNKSDCQPPAKGPGILRIGYAPHDAQGAREPEGVATPGANVGHTCSVIAAASQTSLGGCTDVSRKDGRYQKSPDGEHTFWPHGMSETVRSGTEKYLSEETKTLSHPLQQPLNNQCNTKMSPTKEETNSVQSTFHLNHKPILPGTSVGPIHKPWKAEGAVAGAGLCQRRPSNLSYIERQRGPIKKRHINFQPEVLDLSNRKAKEEWVRSPEGLRVSPDVVCSKMQSTSTQKVLMDHEGVSVALKQEPHLTNMATTELEISQPQGNNFMSSPDESDRKHNVAGNILNLDQKQVANHQLRHQSLGISEVNDAYSASNLVPLLPSQNFVRQWVLHVTQSSDMFAPHNHTAKVSQDSELRHFQTSMVSYQDSLSSSSIFHNPGRASNLSSSSAPVVKPYACDHCSSTFKHRHHVVRHMRAHSGERPFRCDHCSATFARKCVLTNHRRTHTGEKPYICSECGDTFSRKHHLVIHQRTHSGEKPYLCRDCGAAFARSHHVNRHRKTHEKEAEEDAQIRLESNVSGLNHKLPTMVSLDQPGAPLESKSSLAHEVTPVVNTTVEMIASREVQNTENTVSTHEEEMDSDV